MTDNSHSILNYVSIASMVVYLVVSLLLGIAVNQYFKFRFDQVNESFIYLSLIPNHHLEKMKEYYSNIMRSVLETNKLKNIDNHGE